MAPQILKQRFKLDTTAKATTTTAATTAVPTTPRTRQATKKARAKRALRSLAVAITVPVCLTIAIIIFFGSSAKYSALLPKPFWLPPLWLVHSASVASSFLMGFAAWLVWAEGGFHAHSDALPLYISHVSLGITWNPLVLKIGAVPIAFGFCAIHLITLVACYRSFRLINPLAGDLVRPCLAWLAFLTFVNYKLIYLL